MPKPLKTIDTTARRHVELLLFLLQRKTVTHEDIRFGCGIEYLDTSKKVDSIHRKIQRDIDDLIEDGWPISRSVSEEGSVQFRIDDQLAYAGKVPEDSGIGITLTKLCLALHPLALNDSFKYADKLVCAIAKLGGRIGQGTRITSAVLSKIGSAKWNKLLNDLQKGKSFIFTYKDEEGEASKREVKPYGYYELNGNLYLVAEGIWYEYERNDSHVEPRDDIRRYRYDRIVGNYEVGELSFSLPDEFHIKDWIALPFQLGESCGVVHFSSEPDTLQNLLVNAGKAKVELADNELRFAQCADWQAAATWAIGVGVHPTFPQDAVEEYQKRLTASARGILTEEVREDQQVQPDPNQKKKRGGRPRADNIPSQLLALLGMFEEATNENSAINTEDIARVLGVDLETANILLNTLVSLHVGNGLLQFIGDDSETDDEEDNCAWYIEDIKTHIGGSLRLTPLEAKAIEKGLARIGASEDSLYGFDEIKKAYWPIVIGDDAQEEYAGEENSSADPPLVQGHISEPHGNLFDNLYALSAVAAREKHAACFSYRGENDGTSLPRHAAPITFYPKNDYYYMSAYDYDRHSIRNFRVDKMRSISYEPLTDDEIHERRVAVASLGDINWFSDAPVVELIFARERWLSFFNWEGIHEITELDDGRFMASVPWTGSDWLVQHVAAFGGEVQTTDEELAERVKEYAKGLLEAEA